MNYEILSNHYEINYTLYNVYKASTIAWYFPLESLSIMPKREIPPENCFTFYTTTTDQNAMKLALNIDPNIPIKVQKTTCP